MLKGNILLRAVRMNVGLSSPFISQKSHHADRSRATDAVHLFEIPAGDSVSVFLRESARTEKEFNTNTKKKTKGTFISVPHVNLLATHAVKADKRGPAGELCFNIQAFQMVPHEQHEFLSLLSTHGSIQFIFFFFLSRGPSLLLNDVLQLCERGI